MKNYKTVLAILTICICLAQINSAQSNPPYEIKQSVIAGGGGTSNADSYSVTGTIGQAVAGTNSTSPRFGVRGGFWQYQLPLTAAMVAVSGRVSTATKYGIANVRVTMASSDGTNRTALTGPFGYFRFDDVEAGQTYVVSVHSKRFQFENPTQVVSVNDEVTDLNFMALPN